MASRLVLSALLLLFVATPGLGQDAPPARQRGLTPEQRARLLERYRSLPPEERARLRRLYDEHVRDRAPEELEGLRRELRQRVPKEAAQAEQRRRRFEQRPKDEQLRYERLHHQLLQSLPPEERRALLQLEPEQRRKKLQKLVQQHRRKVLDQRVRNLPPGVRQPLQAELEGLDPRERFRRAREAVEGHTRGELRRLLTDPSLSDEQRARQVQELLRRFVPEEERREQLRRKVLSELQRRRDAPPQRPGDDRRERRDPPGERPADRDRPDRDRERQGEGDRPGRRAPPPRGPR
ncbi:MAG: hypothetical protein M9894_10790 [Planctomycetes bacterium]|nr:hypothetical protein [Planctomycetota bacterium]